MRLNLRLKKALAMVAVSAVTVTTVPATVFAADYDTHWAKEMIEKWSEKEVLKGYEDGTFRPNGTVTRGELAAMIVRVFGLTDTSAATKYKDVEQTKWYAEDVAKVSSAGIMNDYTNDTFKPEEKATREEAAYAIAKAYQVATNDETNSFTDQAQISDWAEAEIVALVAGGYLHGNPDGSFRPQGTLTRAEAVTMVDKITADLVNVAGVYSQDIEGNLVVNTTGVELSDMTITGNLYLAEGIGEGEVKLNNVTVLGDIIVEGGSVNTINITGKSVVNNITVDKAGKKAVRVLLGSLVNVKGTATIKSAATLQGSANKIADVVVDGAKEVQLVGNMNITNLTINTAANLVLTDGTVIETATISKDAVGTTLKGTGTKANIKKLLVNANSVKIEKGFDVDSVVVGENVTESPTRPSTGGGGGGGGGGSTGGGTVEATKVQLQKVLVEVVGEEAVREVPITGKDIKVVVNKDNIIINGAIFAKGTEIKSIKAVEANGLDEVKVFVSGNLEETINLTKGYTVDDLANMVETRKADLFKILDDESIKDKLGEYYHGKATAYLTNAIADLNAYAKANDTVSVDYILGRAERVRAKLAQENAKELYDKVSGALTNLAGIEATLGSNNPTVSGKVSVTGIGKGYEPITYTVTVEFK